MNLTNPKPLDKLASFHFKKIELESECGPDLQLCDSIPIFESMFTSVSLPDLDPFSELTLIHVLIDFEFELPILESRILLMGKECEFSSSIWTQLLN